MGRVNRVDNPRTCAVRRDILRDLRRKEYPFGTIGPVIFLCGAQNSQPRERLNAYLKRHHTAAHVFYAESVWDVITRSNPDANALEVEARLAELSDMVLIIVESAGTFAELGAFALSEALRAKLLPVLEIRYQESPSFLKTGPVHWVDRESRFAPSIWVDQRRILEWATEIEGRIAKIPQDKNRRIADLHHSPKHLLFFVCDLVAVFGPSSEKEVRNLARDLELEGLEDIAFHLGLGKAMQILDSFQYDEVEFFFRPLSNGRLQSFHRTRKYLDIPTLRARMLSGLQIPQEGRDLLKAASAVKCDGAD